MSSEGPRRSDTGGHRTPSPVPSVPVRSSRRGGLRRRLLRVLIVAAVAPVTLVSVAAVALIFYSLGQTVEADAARGLQVSRGLLLRQMKEVASQAGQLGDSGQLIDALMSTPSLLPERLANMLEDKGHALVEVTDAGGHILVRCGRAQCGDQVFAPRLRALQSADGSPVIQRALEYERSVSLEAAGTVMVIRAAVPVCDAALRLLGVVVMSVPLDGATADRLKGALGAAREVVFYSLEGASTSTVLAVTGDRLPGPPVPDALRERVVTSTQAVAAMDVGGRTHTVAFGRIQDAEGKPVGFLAVAADREPLKAARRRAVTTVTIGALAALALAVSLAGVVARRLTRPLHNLHAGALAVARGDLDTHIEGSTQPEKDEIDDVAEAFRIMTRSLKENQEGLAARMRELQTVHQVGRAISSVMELDGLLRRVVEEVAAVLQAETAAIALTEDADPNSSAIGFEVRAIAGGPAPAGLTQVAACVAAIGRARRVSAVERDPDLGAVARFSGLEGPLVAAPLSLKDRVVGVIICRRALAFADSDLRLLVTLADQTAAAIENARLYAEVRAFSENLERKVRERTAELEQANAEIERALRELGETQGQLIHSERMAGLGLLVAGIAHEVNSPAAAVQGSVDALQGTGPRLGDTVSKVAGLGMPPEALRAYFDLVGRLLPALAQARVDPPAEVRRRARDLRVRLQAKSGGEESAALLADLGPVAEQAAEELASLAGDRSLAPLTAYLGELAFLGRSAGIIRTAIGSIGRIVGALKSYSRLDEAPIEQVDIHAGIEDTLVILHHKLKYGINVVRRYGEIPAVTAYVGELNQVWTNLIHNAVQAMGSGSPAVREPGGHQIAIETRAESRQVTVVIEDNGPGIPGDVLPRIFEPFFTTKTKGEGTGLGLVIVHRIVEKHGGTIRVESAPGNTRFVITLPVEGPPALRPRRSTPLEAPAD